MSFVVLYKAGVSSFQPAIPSGSLAPRYRLQAFHLRGPRRGLGTIHSCDINGGADGSKFIGLV